MPRKIEDPRVQKERIHLPVAKIPSEILSKDDLINSSYFVFSIPSKSQSQAYPKILEIMRRHNYIEETIENSMFYVIGFESLDAELVTFWKLLPKGWKALNVWINGDKFDCSDYEEKHKIEELITCRNRSNCEGICANNVGLGGWKGLSLHLLKELFDSNYSNPMKDDFYFRENDLAWKLRNIYRDYNHLKLIERNGDAFYLDKERLNELVLESLEIEKQYCFDYNQEAIERFIDTIPSEIHLKEDMEEDEDHLRYLEERKLELEEEKKMYLKLAEEILDKLEKRMKKVLWEFGEKFLKK